MTVIVPEIVDAVNNEPYPSRPWRPPVVEAPKEKKTDMGPRFQCSRLPVSVMVRIKPPWQSTKGAKLAEVEDDQCCKLGLIRPERWADNVVTIGRGSAHSPATVLRCFQAVLGPGASQDEVYQAGPVGLVQAFLERGEDCALLAYGQTGSGKSYTMFGLPGAADHRGTAQKGGRNKAEDVEDGGRSAAAHRGPDGTTCGYSAGSDSADKAEAETGTRAEAPAAGRLSTKSSRAARSEWGLLPRCLTDILQALPAGSAIRLCAVEVYCEEVYDLLTAAPGAVVSLLSASNRNSSAARTQRAARKPADALSGPTSDGKGSAKRNRMGGNGAGTNQKKGKDARSPAGPKIGRKAKGAVSAKVFEMEGQMHTVVRTADDVWRVVQAVEHSRQEHATALNACSSRSHCVVQATLVAPRGSADKAETRSRGCASPALTRGATLTFVDLAGSERLKRSNSEGQRMREAVMVNKSLTTLGRCIRGLAASGGQQDGARPASQTGSAHHRETFIPVRDSALTKLLCKVLQGGRCCLAVTVAQGASNHGETVAALEFGRQATGLQTDVIASMSATDGPTVGGAGKAGEEPS